jgi:hypothetical protein
VPRAAWHELAYIDLPAGTCLLPLAFAAAGVRRVVVNDIAPRSLVAARALFAAPAPSWNLVERALDTTHAPRRRAHVSSFGFASDYLTAEICAVFDRLYFAEMGESSAALRYVALRYVLGFADPEDGFRILMTHDERQLEDDPESDWRPFLARARDGRAALRAIVADIAAGMAVLRTRAVTLCHADMRDVAARLDLSAPCLVAVNPPTAGIDEYVIDDQVAHSLIANRLVPLSRCPETSEAFWRSRVEAALAAIPRGGFYLVWGGDGALDAAQCRETWNRFGAPVFVRSLRLANGRRPDWAIYRRA